jgi:hypothetical protein
MVTVHVGNQNYSVVFERSFVGRMAKQGFENVVQTKCAIFDTGLNPVIVGYAHGSPLDDDNPTKGMRIAFGRAVKKFTKKIDQANNLLFTPQALKLIEGKFHAAFNAAMRAERQSEIDSNKFEQQIEEFIFREPEPASTTYGIGTLQDAQQEPAPALREANLTADQQQELNELTALEPGFCDDTRNCSVCGDRRALLAKLRALQAA